MDLLRAEQAGRISARVKGWVPDRKKESLPLPLDYGVAGSRRE